MAEAAEAIATELAAIRAILEKIHQEFQWAVNNDRLRSDHSEELQEIYSNVLALRRDVEEVRPMKQGELF